jgi:hypothetical protein
LSAISVKRACEKNSSAAANQNRNNQRHERFSCGNRVKYLLRERFQISSKMTCVMPPPLWVNLSRVGAVAFRTASWRHENGFVSDASPVLMRPRRKTRARSFVLWSLRRKSGRPPPFAPSLNVQGDDAHNNSRFLVMARSITDSFPAPHELRWAQVCSN